MPAKILSIFIQIKSSSAHTGSEPLNKKTEKASFLSIDGPDKKIALDPKLIESSAKLSSGTKKDAMHFFVLGLERTPAIKLMNLSNKSLPK